MEACASRQLSQVFSISHQPDNEKALVRVSEAVDGQSRQPSLSRQDLVLLCSRMYYMQDILSHLCSAHCFTAFLLMCLIGLIWQTQSLFLSIFTRKSACMVFKCFCFASYKLTQLTEPTGPKTRLEGQCICMLTLKPCWIPETPCTAKL